jgi:Sulfotransferase family
VTAPPFFIVGCDRSGTTLLRLILDRGGEVAIPTESMIVVDFARFASAQLDSDAEFDRLARAVWRHPKVREWGLTEPPPRREGRTGAAAYRAALEAPFLAYASARGVSRWADKTPHYVLHIDAVRDVFPDARFVHLVRDGRDVALSLLRVPFGPGNVWAAAHQWRDAVDAGDAAAERLGDVVLTVRYEDLVAVPEATVRRVCEFCDLHYGPEMLAVDRTGAERLIRGQEGWFTQLSAGITTGSAGRWRSEMSPARQALFTSVAADALRRHGYDLPDHGASPPPVPAAAYAAHNWAVKLVQFGRLHVVQERGREVPQLVRRRLSRRA